MPLKRFAALLLAVLFILPLAACTPAQPGSDDPVEIGPGVDTPTPAPVDDGPVGEDITAMAAAPIGMVAAGSVHSVGLRADGTAVSAGHDTVGQRNVKNWDNLVYIAAGATFTAGVKADGTLVTAGQLAGGNGGAETASWSNLHSVAVGEKHIAGLKNDGTVVAAGDNAQGQCDVAGWGGIVAVAAGDTFTVGLTAKGTLIIAGAAPDVSAWTNVVAVAAGGDKIAAITADGTALATSGDVTGWSGLADIAAGAYGVVGVRTDGTVLTALVEAVELPGETDVVDAAVGEKHIVLMHKDGTATAYGENDDLQCTVDRFFLRPYREAVASPEGASYYVYGFRPGMTVGEATPILQAVCASESAYFAKADGAAAADTDLIATGLVAFSGADAPYAEVALMGDVNGDGVIDEADAAAAEANQGLSALAKRAAQAREDQDWSKIGIVSANIDGTPTNVYTNSEAGSLAEGARVIRAYAAGTGKVSQYGDWHRSAVTESYEAAYAKNGDTVGYIEINGTNISYPILTKGPSKPKEIWYYNSHTFEGKEAESGSIYPYFYNYGQNNVITGHNSRPSGTMFHQLHHLQEFNLGETHCLHKKNCGKELVDLPDFNVYADRVWTLNLYGVETRYEIFAMYETTAPADLESTWYDNAWWGSHYRTTKEGVQQWIDKQLGLTEFQFDTTVTADDTFATIFTCATEHADADKNARLFYFLKRVD